MTAETKNCPACGQLILDVARKCRHCRQYLDPSARPAEIRNSAFDRILIPVDRPVSAIAAGYLGLFSLIPLFGFPVQVLAIVFGVVALKKIKADPTLAGKGRAWFGIIVGGIMILATIAFFIFVLVEANTSSRH